MATTAKASPRNRSLDSLAGVLMVAVVFGHAVEMVDGKAAGSAFHFIYFFHMPAFVWLSGLLTQYSRKWSVGQLVARLLFPFIVFQVIQVIVIGVWNGESILVEIPSIGWTLWYIFALFVWRLFTPVLIRTRWTIPLSIVVSLTAGMIPVIGYGFSLARILGFLPFFVIGLFWRREWLEVISRFWWLGVLAFIAVAVLAWSIYGRTDTGPWLMAESSQARNLSTMDGTVERSAILLLAFALILAIISVAYRPLPIVATIGAATLPVYLLHSLFLMPWHLDGITIGVTGGLAVAVLLVGSVAFSWLASQPVVVHALQPLTDFTWWSSRFGIGTAHEKKLEFDR